MAVSATHVFRWDLDKTYLRTEFDTLRDLVKSAFETAQDKQAYPGAPALLRSLRQSPEHRICLVSGSPSQMRKVLAAKLALDGVEYDEFVLKNNLRNIGRLRLRALRAQVPYKLPALLESRLGLLGTPPETLFGDDAEADAIIYCLYADILAGVVSQGELERVMEAARAYDDQTARTLALAERVRRGDAVGRIMIHLDRRSPTAGFAPYGARLVPIYNYFQAALILYGDRVLTAQQVLFVAREMLDSPEHEIPTLANSLQDLVRRGRLPRAIALELAGEVQDAAAGAADRDGRRVAEGIAAAFHDRLRHLGGAPPLEQPETSPRLDYVELVDAEFNNRRGGRKRHRA
ncbi:MAG TPA: hypothetical protein VK698_03070 [Kofleriaceae bacterium]|nr:hypothetical protein [Kofleriaceae bacterium]